MNPDQLVLRHQVNLINTVVSIWFIGVDHVKFVVVYCYHLYLLSEILQQFIIVIVKILLQFYIC